METLKQTEARIIAGMNENRRNFSHYLGKNVQLTFNDSTTLLCSVCAVGGYFINITGVNGLFDPSLRGKTKVQYKDLISINII